ncbi:MAG: hypothetical protein ABSD10_02260 [Candidatus Saccharimonadales bacterium]
MRSLSVPAIVVGAFLMIASPALASTNSITKVNASVNLYRPFPNGIDPNNPQHALQQVEGRAAWDPSYAMTIAQQADRPDFVLSEYRAEGYAPHASPGSTNSGITGGGTVVPVADHNGSQYVKVFLMINIVSQKTVELMVRCGNPRLKPSVSVVVLPWKPFSKGTVIRFNRKLSKPVSITCPSGQKVSGVLTTTVSGFTRATTWGKVQGSLDLKLREKVSLHVKSWVTLKCGPAPPPTPTAHLLLGKTAYLNGTQVTLNGGEFGFSQSVNGSATSSTTNAASGQSRDLGTFNAGAVVQECETSTGGYTPDQTCITHTAVAGETYTFPFVNRKTVTAPPPTPTAHLLLGKTAYLNGTQVTLNGGEFGFSQSVNGSATSSTTNAASGQSRDLGTFNAGAVVQECETSTGGYTPDQTCITHTAVAGETYTFPFVNRKTVTAPPPVIVVSATATATASASCSDGTTASASATASAEATTYAEAYAAAYALALASAEASVSCSVASPPSPPTPTMLINNCYQPEEDAVGQQYANLYCDVYSPSGDTITVVFSTSYGHFTCLASTTFTSAGYNRVYAPCNYVAPTEIPPGGNDTYTVTVTDVTNSAVLAVSATTPFPIHDPDVHP